MFPKYPYLDLSDRNLDFLTKAIRELESDVKNFVSINAVKYANPIQWSIVQQYEKNTVVIDANTGVAYLSTREVPSGVNITRTDYWVVIFDLSRFILAGVKNLANSYEQNLTYSATVPTNKGGWIVWNGTLYKALNDIHIGDSYVINGNVEIYTVEKFVDDLIVKLNNEISDRESGELEIKSLISSEVRARMSEDEIINALIASEVRARTSEDEIIKGLIDAEDRARVDNDNILNGKIDAINDKINDNFTSEYDANSQNFITDFNSVLTSLSHGIYFYEITANNHKFSAIVTKQDPTHISILLSSFSNGDTDGIIGVWNYNPQSSAWVWNLYPSLDDIPHTDLLSKFYENKKVLILGDSLSSVGRPWVNKFTEFVESVGGSVTNWAVNSYTSADMLNKLTENSPEHFDLFIMWIGQNDWNQHILPGNTGAAFVQGTFGYNVESALNLLITKYDNPQGALIGIHYSVRNNIQGKLLARREWSRMSFYCAKKYGHTFIDMNKAPFIGWGQDPNIWTVVGDNVHFNDDYQINYLWEFIAKSFAEKNDGLVGLTTEYNINNASYMFTPSESVSIYRIFYDVEDSGFAHLYLILQTNAQLTPSNGIVVLGNWNFNIFSNYETSLTAVNTATNKVYNGLLIHGNNGVLRLYTSEAIPNGATLQIDVSHIKTNQLPFYLPSNL